MSAPPAETVPASVSAGALVGSDPVGHLDTVSAIGSVIHLGGWAGDFDAPGRQRVHLYVDGKPKKAISTTVTRADVARVHPRLGTVTGFATALTASVGHHTVCAIAINLGGGRNTTLGCRTVTIGRAPIGRLETAVESGNPWG